MPSSRHRPDAVRARRVLAVAAIAVAVAQLAAGLALDTAPARVRFAHGARVLDQARALGGAPYVLLLGSSRFWQLDADTAAVALRETVGGDGPGLLKGAMPAGDPIVADYLLVRLLAEGSHPRLIALEISPEIIANPSRWVAEHAVRFFTWRDVAVWTPEIVRAGKTRQVAAARFAPIHLYRRELLTWITGVQPPYLRVAAPVQAAAAGPADHDGAGPNAATLFGLRETRKWLRRYRVDGGAARALERLLARCHDAGIRVALVGVPVSSWVRELYTPEIERTFGAYIDRVSRRYGAEFVDYRAKVPDRFFRDHHHLNRRGSELFVRLLVAEVLAPRWSASAAAS